MSNLQVAVIDGLSHALDNGDDDATLCGDPVVPGATDSTATWSSSDPRCPACEQVASARGFD